MTRRKVVTLILAWGLLLALVACDGGRVQPGPATLPPPTATLAQSLPTLALPSSTPGAASMKAQVATPVPPSPTSPPATLTPGPTSSALATPTRTRTVRPLASPIPFPTPEPTKVVIYALTGIPACKTRANVNLRSAPSLNAAVITVVPRDRWVWPVNWWADDENWRRVVIADGRHGYVADDLVDCQFVLPDNAPPGALPTEAAEKTLEQLRTATPAPGVRTPLARPTLRPPLIVTLRPDIPMLIVTPTPRFGRIFTQPGPLLEQPSLPRLLPTPTPERGGILTRPGPVIVEPSIPRLLRTPSP